MSVRDVLGSQEEEKPPFKRQVLSEHRHSGRLLAHHHTSYPALAFLVLVAVMVVAGFSYATRAASSVVGISVMGPAPTVAATINQPADGVRVSTGTQTVRGTCPTGLLVEIYRNGTFAGSGICHPDGLYTVLISLTFGANQLVARDVDALGQYGPGSNIVNITRGSPAALRLAPGHSPSPSPSLTPAPTPVSAPVDKPVASVAPRPSPVPTRTPAPTLGAASGGAPAATGSGPPLMLAATQHVSRGTVLGESVRLTVSPTGGQPPYRLNWEWGDGSSNQSPPSSAAHQSKEHIYDRPGPYQATIWVADVHNQQSVIQLAVIVDGSVATTASSDTGGSSAGLVMAWPLLTSTSLVVLSFWLGERHRLAGLRPAAT